MKDALFELFDMLRDSVILQAYITVIIVTVAAYLWATHGTIPSELLQALYVVLGFFFGAKYQHIVEKRRKE